MGWGMMGGFGGGWLMWLGMIVFWGLVIWGVIALARGTAGHSHSESPRQNESALEVLKRRYVSGDINRDEFEQKKRDITG
jgi:putative membrane protein